MKEELADVYLRFVGGAKDASKELGAETDPSPPALKKSKKSKKSKVSQTSSPSSDDLLIPAHTFVLATRSPRFRVLLKPTGYNVTTASETTFNGKRIVDVLLCSSESTIKDFKALLFYVYSGRLPKNSEVKFKDFNV